MTHCSPGTLILGFIGILLVAKLARRLIGRRASRCGGDARRGGPGRFFIGRSRWLRGLFARLDTTPGQEREIRAALEDLSDRWRDAAAGVRASKEVLGRAIEGEIFDESAVEAMGARLDAASAQMKDAATAALRRVHAILDDAQRARLAVFLKGGRAWAAGGGGGGPYRGAPGG